MKQLSTVTLSWMVFGVLWMASSFFWRVQVKVMYRTGITRDGQVIILLAQIGCSVLTVPLPFAATIYQESCKTAISSLLERYMKNCQSFILKLGVLGTSFNFFSGQVSIHHHVGKPNNWNYSQQSGHSMIGHLNVTISRMGGAYLSVFFLSD